jgi:hypothetical protein
MAKQRVEDVVTDTAAEVADTVQGKLDQGKGIFQDFQAGAGEAIDKATALVRDVSTAGSQAIAQAGEVVQGVAREVSSQAGQAAATAYQQGAHAEGYLRRYAAEQPLTALLIVGALGYGLAYLMHRP